MSIEKRGAQSSCLIRYFVQQDATLHEEVHDRTALNILEETWDILESPVFVTAEQDCLEMTFGIMKEKAWGAIFFSEETCAWASRPLAQVVTRLRVAAGTIYGQSSLASAVSWESNPNIYVPRLEQIPSVTHLGDVSFN